ncbi:unnamed protein product [Rhizoctonia solani]|uniref:F-box domain-containing protein n=1 Tax=Rhizoctonia solani TaxID=456999 RepID=A0A8H3H6E8_9AGAM|nr:unnamed protein product [Rhizoctonia solani]CAE6528969.1 unnamed protein product [Rhizoctonia solani]
MVQPFGIPEILCLICQQARRSDLARLLATSHLFFDCAMPLVWRCLPGSAPIILMKLIPDANNYLKNNSDDTLAESLKPLDAQLLLRFNLYAPHVKKLIRHRRNRQSNVIWALSSEDVIHDPASCLAVYLSPTLVAIENIHLRDAYSCLGSQGFCELVSSIARQCPYIHSFELGNMGYRTEAGFNLASKLANSLKQLYYLRKLKLGKVVLEPEVLTALSTLPNLESLAIEEMSSSEIKPLDASFSTNGFPALRHLGINPIYSLTLVTQVWNVTALVQQLTSVSLPLQRLWLSGEINHSYEAHWDSEHFARAFPSMEYLRIEGYHLTFKDLAFIAKHMSRLRRLSARVKMNSNWPSGDGLSSFVLTPSSSCLCFHLQIVDPNTFLEMHSGLTIKEIEAIAAGLHALWPEGIICESYRRPDKGGDLRYTDRINAALGQLREVDGQSNQTELMLQNSACKRIPPWVE